MTYLKGRPKAAEHKGEGAILVRSHNFNKAKKRRSSHTDFSSIGRVNLVGAVKPSRKEHLFFPYSRLSGLPVLQGKPPQWTLPQGNLAEVFPTAETVPIEPRQHCQGTLPRQWKQILFFPACENHRR